MGHFGCHLTILFYFERCPLLWWPMLAFIRACWSQSRGTLWSFGHHVVICISMCPVVSDQKKDWEGFQSYKGQLISKALVGILNSSKKWTKQFNLSTMIPQVDFLFCFFEELKTPKSLFEINWPLVDECLTNEKVVHSIHSVSYVYAVLPFNDVKCLCSRGREWEREESHSH